MPLIEISMLTGALIEIAVDATWDRARKHQAVQQILRNLGIDFDPASQDFDDVYNYTLAAFGIGKPSPLVEVFYQRPVRELCRRAFDTGDTALAEREIRELIDWPTLERILKLDVSPEPLIREFQECFQDAVNRSRTVVQVRQDWKLDEIISRLGQLELNQSQGIAGIETILSQRLPQEEPGTDRLDREQVYHGRIDQARELIQEDKADAALTILQKLHAELRDREISHGLMFRLLTNLGACFLPLGEEARAVPYFEQALAYAPEDPKALANAGLAALIEDNLERARTLTEQALQIQADHPSALSVWVQVVARAGQLDGIDPKARVLIEENIESRRALAVVLTEAGRFEAAESLLRRSLESNDYAPQDLALLAQAILSSVQTNRQKRQPLPWATSVDETSRLQEAERLLDQVVEAWKLLANRKRFQTVLELRLQSRALQGKFDLAEQDCQRILLETPNHSAALYNCGRIARRQQDLAAAIKRFTQCLDEPQMRAEAQVLLAEAYLRNKQPQEALDVLTYSEDEPPEQEQSIQLDRLSLVAKATHSLGDNGRLATVMERLQTFHQNDPEVLEVIANVDVFRGDLENAVDHLQHAIQVADAGVKDRLILHLAQLYYYQNQFDKAIPLYEAVVSMGVDTPPTREYLICLLNSGDWDRAYDLASRIRSGGAAIPVISEVEARITEYIGDLESALHLYLELGRLEPDEPEHFLRVAAVYVRQGKTIEAASYLDSVLKRFQDDPKTLIETAKVFAIASRPAEEILSVAYRARRLGHTPEIHLSYVGLFLKVDNDPSLDLKPVEVTIGSSVQLTSGRETLWYTILDDEPIRRENLEFKSSDSIAKILLGRKVGETVRIKEGSFEQPEYLVTEIQSKYVRAFQDTMLNFGIWFPDHQGLQRVEIVENDFSPVFLMTGAAARWQEKIQELYASKQLTLEGFAQIIGRGIIAVWRGSTVGNNFVSASLGNAEEQAYHRRIVTSSASVAVDLMALFTLSHLQHLPILLSRFREVFIAQGCIDVLYEEIQQLRQFDRDHGWIGLEGDRFIVGTVPKEAIEYDIRFLEGILAFVRENCSIVPIRHAVELGQKQFEQSEHIIGRSSTASILAAKETQSFLFSDDLVVRTIAKGVYSVDGAWTQPILLNAQEHNVLTAAQYYESVEALVLANYRYVSLNTAVLIHVLEKNRWVITPDVTKVFSPLSSPETQWAGAINILSELVASVWHKRILGFSKQQIVDLCLRTLAANRGGTDILAVYQPMLQERFPPDEVKEWFMVHRLLAK